MEKIFLNSKKLGDGYFCSSGQFGKSFVIDFYDGIVEGLMLVQGSNYIVHAKKIWWDNGQDNRLFECVAIPLEFLSNVEDLLTELFDSKTNATKHSAKLVANAEHIKNAVLGHSKPLVFQVLCKNLRSAIFVLPSES